MQHMGIIGTILSVLYPFAAYRSMQTESGERVLRCSSICVISDALKHDTYAVSKFVETVMPSIKKSLGPGL